MRRLQKFGAAVLMAVMLAGGATSVQAAGKKDGGDAKAAICAYLWKVITYPYVNPVVRELALAKFNELGCVPPQ